MSDLVLLGLDGGATKVLAQACTIDHKSSLITPTGDFAESIYRDATTFSPDFSPLDLEQQQKEASSNTYHISEQEAKQSESITETIARTIGEFEGVIKVSLMGLCFPGIKTPKLDGVSIMANGPRNIKMLSMINNKIKTNNHTKLMMREIYDDSECCLIGEWKSSIGKLQNSENAIYIGGGTGIADGIILGNKIVDIRNSKKIKRSWELTMPTGKSVEYYLSLGGMLNQWGKGRSIEAMQSLIEYATSGDIAACQIIENASQAFDCLIKNRVSFFQSYGTTPEKIVIGQRLGSMLSDDDNPLSKLIFQGDLSIPIEISTHRNTAALGAAYKAYDNHK